MYISLPVFMLLTTTSIVVSVIVLYDHCLWKIFYERRVAKKYTKIINSKLPELLKNYPNELPLYFNNQLKECGNSLRKIGDLLHRIRAMLKNETNITQEQTDAINEAIEQTKAKMYSIEYPSLPKNPRLGLTELEEHYNGRMNRCNSYDMIWNFMQELKYFLKTETLSNEESAIIQRINQHAKIIGIYLSYRSIDTGKTK